MQECGQRRCRLGLQGRDAGGGGGADAGWTLKVEPIRFAHDLMWRERKREREAWRMTARFLGTTALCVSHMCLSHGECELLKAETVSIHLGNTTQNQAH